MKKQFKLLIFCIMHQAILLSSQNNLINYNNFIVNRDNTSIINTANSEERRIMLGQLRGTNVRFNEDLQNNSSSLYVLGQLSLALLTQIRSSRHNFVDNSIRQMHLSGQNFINNPNSIDNSNVTWQTIG